MSASPPVARTNLKAAATLGCMLPGGELRDDLVVAPGAELREGRRLGRPEAAVDAVDLGEDDEAVGDEPFGEERAGGVLVDHGVRALQASVAADDRDAAPAGRDRDGAGRRERANSIELEDRRRLGGGDDAAKAAAGVLDERPATLAPELLGPLLVVEGPRPASSAPRRRDRPGRLRRG
ncbi:MAG TPA: hypothetical protein VHK22_01055 [Gaiellaceae bacterium]|nr:hypothetical protein [Gaiellaceae bacterium]